MSAHLYDVLVQYRDWTTNLPVRANVAVIVSMMERGITLDKPEMLLLQAVLEDWLDNLRPERDSLLERVYFKLYDAWPIDPPYFVEESGLPNPHSE